MAKEIGQHDPFQLVAEIVDVSARIARPPPHCEGGLG